MTISQVRIPTATQSKTKVGQLFGSLDGLLEAPVCALDIETTGLKWGCRLIGLSLAWRDPAGRLSSLYLSFSEQLDLFGSSQRQDALSVLWSVKDKLVALHTQGFDIRHLFYNLGPSVLPNNIVDVAVLSSMVGPQEDRKLTTLYKKYIGDIPAFVLAEKEQRGYLWLKPASQVAEYARWDAEATLLLLERFQPMLQGHKQQELLERDMAFTRLVNRLMEIGLPVDRPEVERRMALFSQSMDSIRQEMKSSGVYLNPNSDSQVLQYIVKQPGYAHIQSTEAGVLAELEGSIPFMSEIVRYRQYSKAIGSWFKDLLAYSSADGRFHAQLNPFGTRSFRMSSSDFNAQAIPMKERTGKDGRARAFGAMAGIFKSDWPDDLLWSFDLKQAEVRFACILSNDQALAELFADKISDVYRSMSRRIWQTEDRRQDAKRATLAAIYETGSRTFAITNGLEFDKAKDILNAFREAFPALRKASRGYETQVKRTGYVETFDGRRRWFTEQEETYKGFNQLVQTTVSEYMQLLMLAVDQAFPGRLLLQVHDSLVMYAPRDQQARRDMHREIERLANSVLPAEMVRKTNMYFAVDSESWQGDEKD